MDINRILKKILEVDDLISKKHEHSNKNILDKINQSSLDNWSDKYTKNEIDNKISRVITDLDWKESVNTFSDISKTYPKPDDGWTVNVKDNNITYRYDGSKWIDISSNSIPLATSSLDGRMSKNDKSKLDGIANNANNYTHPSTHAASMITEDSTHRFMTDTERNNLNDCNNKKHTHDNNSIIDKITQALLDNWNSAFSHVSDAVKHITSNERNLWNTVSNRVSKSGDTISNPNYRGQLNIKRDANGFSEILYSNINGNLGSMGFDPNQNAVITNGNDTKTTKIYHEGNKPSKSDVGLNNVDNTSDLEKPISKATQNALNGKANSSHTHSKANITDMPTKLSQFVNDKGYITASDVDTSQNHVHSNKPILDKITQALIDSWNTVNKKTDKSYVDGELTKKANNHNHPYRQDTWVPSWGDVTGKPSTYTPSGHTHDDRYYTETEINTKINDLNNKINSKANSSHTHTKSQITDFPTSLPANGGTSSACSIDGYGSHNGLFAGIADGADFSKYNLELSSWYGIGFTSTCGTNGCTTVINTRNGDIASKGTINANNLQVNGANVYTTNRKPNKSDVGLNNVDNTNDLEKPISKATQNALNNKIDKSASCNKNWNWSGQGGQPNWLWGGNDSNNMYVYNPSNFNVSHAKSSDSANTAVKLATARNIALNGAVTGNAIFDGSENININTTRSGYDKYFSFNNVAYMKLLTITVTSNYSNSPIIFDLIGRSANQKTTFTIKFNNENNITPNISLFTYEGSISYGSNAKLYKVSATGNTYEVWIKQAEGYDAIAISNLFHSNCTVNFNGTTATSLPNNYATTINCSIATITSNVYGTATKATQDSDGKQINMTYVKKGMTWNELEGV
ncbi:tail fiber protein [Clostridium weizhouense]|uniref:tail fiber protein n=1 Tax=Clostridium weizhouense TaxID=2859781 RepID=UPI002155FB74|nr:tail fiber protein [Clostridium weizhouense]